MVVAMTNGKRTTETWRFGAFELPLDRYEVAGAKQHMVLLYGPWDHAQLLSPVATALQQLGVDVVVVELPGCGRCLDLPVNEYGTWVELVVALCAFERERRMRCEEERNDQELVLSGIGLGGTLAYFAAAQASEQKIPIERLFVTALADPRQRPLRTRLFADDWSAQRTLLGWHWLSMLGSQQRRLPQRVLGRVVCADATLQRQLEHDPLCVPHHSVRFLSSIFATAPAVQPEAFRACPVIVVAPTADRWLQLEPTLDFYRRLPGAKQLHMLQDAGHLPIDSDSAETLAMAFKDSCL